MEPRYPDGLDENRVVEYVDDAPILPDSTRDDTDAGWGEVAAPSDDWLRAERPPHWE
jgi:hypothetical protein